MLHDTSTKHHELLVGLVGEPQSTACNFYMLLQHKISLLLSSVWHTREAVQPRLVLPAQCTISIRRIIPGVHATCVYTYLATVESPNALGIGNIVLLCKRTHIFSNLCRKMDRNI